MIASAPKGAPRRNDLLDPLENGERISAPEFLHRYEAMPHVKKAELIGGELIEGVVYLGSPVRVEAHAVPDNLAQTWLGNYSARTPGTQAAGNGTAPLDVDNVPQSDTLLVIVEECGGTSHLDSDGYQVGPTELVAEIAASSSSIDLNGQVHRK